MATVNYSSEINLQGRYVKVEWSNLGAGDDGQPFDCSGLRLASIHYWGTFSGGRLTTQVSNELSPSNFVDFHDNTAPGMQIHVATNIDRPFVGVVRPIADGSVSSVGVSMIFVIA